jgi:hypothetical protein
VTGAPNYRCPSGTTGVATCPSSNQIGSCTLVTSESSPDGGIVTYSTIEYYYCTGALSMTSASQLQAGCTSSNGTWTTGTSACGGDAGGDARSD